MQNKQELRCLASVIFAGTLWGFMGVFRRYFGEYGIDSAGLIFLRCGTAALMFFLMLLICDPSGLKIKLKDIWCFLGTGLCSMLFFTYCYFQAINLMSLSAAAILLYTAPFFVILLSALFFGERFTSGKIVALVIAFAGCCLVSGVGGDMQVSGQGLLFGLGSGIGYALYSIFAKFALEKGYTTNTINLYTHSFAALGSALIWGIQEPLQISFSSLTLILATLSLGFFTCFLPYLLYTYSLTGLEAGKASIYANIEPVVATVAGVFIFKESLSLQNMIGIAMVFIAVILLNRMEFSEKEAQ